MCGSAVRRGFGFEVKSGKRSVLAMVAMVLVTMVAVCISNESGCDES